MPAVDPAFNPHVTPAAIGGTGLETPPLTPLESDGEEKTFLPLEKIIIPTHAQEPLDTSFLGVSLFLLFCFGYGLTSIEQRMRKYMPGGHQRFLDHLKSLRVGPTIRDLIHSQASSRSSPSPALGDAYNTALKALSGFRDAHIRVVTRYVICPARSGTIVRDPALDSGAVRGTGGTSLVPLLKVYRNETLGRQV